MRNFLEWLNAAATFRFELRDGSVRFFVGWLWIALAAVVTGMLLARCSR